MQQIKPTNQSNNLLGLEILAEPYANYFRKVLENRKKAFVQDFETRWNLVLYPIICERPRLGQGYQVCFVIKKENILPNDFYYYFFLIPHLARGSK